MPANVLFGCGSAILEILDFLEILDTLGDMLDEEPSAGQTQQQVCPWCEQVFCFGECCPGRIAEPIVDGVMVRRETVCMDCDRPFRIGEPYTTRLEGFVGPDPITEIVCVSCGLATAGMGD